MVNEYSKPIVDIFNLHFFLFHTDNHQNFWFCPWMLSVLSLMLSYMIVESGSKSLKTCLFGDKITTIYCWNNGFFPYSSTTLDREHSATKTYSAPLTRLLQELLTFLFYISTYPMHSVVVSTVVCQ